MNKHRFPVLMGNNRYGAYARKVLDISRSTLIGYWPLQERAGTTGAGSVKDISGRGFHGTPTAVTFGVTGIGDGRTAASFNGTTSVINVFSAGLAALVGNAGTLVIWAQVSGAADWTDGATHAPSTLRTDDSSSAFIGQYKFSGTNSRVNYSYRGSTVWKNAFKDTTATAWMCLASTWDQTADKVRHFWNGAQLGADLTGLGAWAGPITVATIGESSWKGSLAHCALWSSALTPTQIASLAIP